MTWWNTGPCSGVLELAGARGFEVELLVWWGDGRLRCAWAFSQTGAIAWWADVGIA